mgnify:FL=1
MAKRAMVGDVVRLYGYPGTYMLQEYRGNLAYDYFAAPGGVTERGWPCLDSSLVEINGVATPLLSAPLVPPALDYPHTPLYDYKDGGPGWAARFS